MARKVVDYHDIAIDGMTLSEAIDILSAAREMYGVEACLSTTSEFGESVCVERDETYEERLERMRRETVAWKQRVRYEDDSKIRARNIQGVEAYKEWERNRLPNVD